MNLIRQRIFDLICSALQVDGCQVEMLPPVPELEEDEIWFRTRLYGQSLFFLLTADQIAFFDKDRAGRLAQWLRHQARQQALVRLAEQVQAPAEQWLTAEDVARAQIGNTLLALLDWLTKERDQRGKPLALQLDVFDDGGNQCALTFVDETDDVIIGSGKSVVDLTEVLVKLTKASPIWQLDDEAYQ